MSPFGTWKTKRRRASAYIPAARAGIRYRLGPFLRLPFVVCRESGLRSWGVIVYHNIFLMYKYTHSYNTQFFCTSRIPFVCHNKDEKPRDLD